jgi:hypothetical protein
MSKKVATKKMAPESSSASESDEESDPGEQLLVGQGDALGGYDDSQFQEDDNQKKKKTNNIVRK